MTVNHLIDDEDDDAAPPGRSYARQRQASSAADDAEREISLGTPAILGIFFALALVCACFFGFGYTLGRKSAQSANVDAAAANPSDATSSIGSPKPTAGSYFSQPSAPTPQPVQEVSVAPPAQTDSAPAATIAPARNTVSPADTMIVGDKAVGDRPAAARPAPAAPQPAAAASQPATVNLQPGTSFVVQIAAVSSQDVADILTTSLAKKGYTVAVRHEPQDKLLHVQIGPFPTRKEAQAMQARVLADGFNAIVK
jgi:cell division septation protein DedD